LIAAVLERFAVALVFNFGGGIESRLGRTESANDFARAFFADAFGAGNVVDRIAHQRHHVDNFLRWHAHQFFDLGFVHHDVRFGRARSGAQHAHAPADQLHHVFVAGDDGHVELALIGLARECADDVVGFVTRRFEHGQAHGFANFSHVGQLHGEIFGHRRALRLVFGEELVAKRRPGNVEGHADVVRLVFFDQAAQHVGEKIRNFGRQAGRVAQTVHRREKRAEDEAHRVDQEKFLRGLGGHARQYSKRVNRGRCAGHAARRRCGFYRMC
jgi:hypothetical protein